MIEPAPVPALIEVAGHVYNRDHIVKIDLTNPETVVIHTTTGADPYSGEIGQQVRRYFSPGPAPQASGQGGDGQPGTDSRGKRQKNR